MTDQDAKKQHLAKIRSLLGKRVTRKQFTTFLERSTLYDDVRALLSPGFISKNVQINGVGLGLRTLNYEDLLIVEGRTGLQPEEWVDWVLATSIWVVGGQMVKKDQEALLFLYGKLKTFPNSLKAPLMTTLAILNNRFSRARERALSYFYERESRDLWMSRGLSLFEGEFSWVGRNALQDLWAFYNRMEDARVQRVFEQNMAGFQVSPHAPESIKKMVARAKHDDETLERDRSIVQDKMFFEAFGVVYDAKLSRQFQIDSVEKAETFEDLEREMKNWAMGKKDRHDLAVEKIQNNIKKLRRFKKWKRDKLRRESEARSALARSQGDNRNSVVLVGAEADQILADFARQAAQMPKVSDMHDNSRYDKYLGDDEASLELDANGQVVNNIPEEMRDAFTKQILASLKSPD